MSSVSTSGQSPFLAWTEPRRIDKAAVDIFTPMLFMGGMIGRSTGASALDAIWLALLVEVGANAFIRNARPVLGPRAIPETGINILVDVVAGFTGWLVMDAVMRNAVN